MEKKIIKINNLNNNLKFKHFIIFESILIKYY